jgi:hypothetical protein
MSVHKLTEAALTRLVYRAFITAVLNAVGLLAASLFLIWKLQSQWTVLMAVGPVLLLGVWSGVRRADAMYRTYEIVVDEVGISRSFKHVLQEQITFADLGPVVEVPGEGMLLRSLHGTQRLAISSGVADYEKIREKVGSLARIELASRARRSVRVPGAMVLGIGTLVSIVTFVTTGDPIVASVSGSLLIVGIGAGTVVMLRRGGLSFARIAAAMLALAIAALIALRILLAITGGWPGE